MSRWPCHRWGRQPTSPAVDSGMPSSIEGGLAQTLTRIDVQRGTDDIRVVISGDGRLAHEVTRLDERRLMIDIPRVASAIRKPVMSVNHQILKQVRLGYHADKVRVVLDLAGKAAYSVEPQGRESYCDSSGRRRYGYGREIHTLTVARRSKPSSRRILPCRRSRRMPPLGWLSEQWPRFGGLQRNFMCNLSR